MQVALTSAHDRVAFTEQLPTVPIKDAQKQRAAWYCQVR
jgi:hypothetical protein